MLTPSVRRFPLHLALGILIAGGLASCGDRELGWPACDLEAGLESGPVVGFLPAERAVITFETRGLETTALEYGVAGSAEIRRLPALVQHKRHRFELQGIQPGQSYWYRISRGASVPLRTYELRAPPTDAEAPVRLVALGDFGCGCLPQMRLIRLIESLDPDAVLALGDVAYPRGTRKQVRGRFLRPFGNLLARIPFYAVLGNHDIRTDGGMPLLERLTLPEATPEGGETFYGVNLGCVSLLALDSEHDVRRDAAQVRWLASELAKPQARWRMVMAHRPVYSAGRHGADRRLHDAIVPVMDQYAPDFFLSGHDHNYQRSHPLHGGVRTTDGSGTTYIVSGGGGHELYDVRASDPRFASLISAHHICVLDCAPDHVRIRAIDLEGKVIDAFEHRRPIQRPHVATYAEGVER